MGILRKVVSGRPDFITFSTFSRFLLSESGPTASGMDQHLSPSSFGGEQGPQVPILSPRRSKSAIFGTFASLATSGPTSHLGPFGSTSGHSETPQKRSLDGSVDFAHPGPFKLARPGNRGPDQGVRNAHPGMPWMQEYGPPTFLDHF